MKTTKKQALKIYNIIKWINPYEICDLDKETHINNLMSLSLEDNINELEQYICDGYETRDLLNDTTLLKKYLDLKKYLGNLEA